MTQFPIDKHKNKTAIVFAHGPSAKKYIPELLEKSRDKNNYCFITMGEIDKIQENLNIKFDIDYWVMANTEMTVKNSYLRFNKYPKTTLVWADTADTTPYSIAWKLLKISNIPYDQRHFGNIPCNNCKVPVFLSQTDGAWMPIKCRVVPDRLTVQEELQEYTKYDKHYGTGSTVALHSTSLGILSGCKEIHLYGIDLDCRNGYVDGKTSSILPDIFDPNVDEIVNDFDIINKSAHNIGVKIINHSENSPIKKVIKTVCSESRQDIEK
jgi:hypothetical protein